MSSTARITWVRLALNFTFQGLPMVIFVGMLIQFSRRVNAAEAKGFVLCSRCEYLLASEIELQTCPECGCTRSITAHKEAWKGWRSWLT